MDKLIKKCIEQFFKDNFNDEIEVTRIIEKNNSYYYEYRIPIYNRVGELKWINLKSDSIDKSLINPYLRNHKLSRIKNKLS